MKNTAPKYAARMFETIVGCKWSLHVLGQIRAGVCRPGALERSSSGLSRKVLNQRLQKMLRYGIVQRKVFPVIPPHVEYRLTSFGRRFIKILDAVNKLDKYIDQQ